jgi:hypothetical protein
VPELALVSEWEDGDEQLVRTDQARMSSKMRAGEQSAYAKAQLRIDAVREWRRFQRSLEYVINYFHDMTYDGEVIYVIDGDTYHLK